jgi:hypothetical protein
LFNYPAIEDSWAYRHQINLTLPIFSDYDGVSQPTTSLASYLTDTTAFKAMINWPVGFYEFLEAYRCRQGKPLPRDLLTDLGDFYRTWLQKRWQHPTFQFIQDVFDQYLLDYYPRSITVIRSPRYSSNPTFACKFAFMPVSEAAHLLNMQPILAEGMIQSGKLTGYEALERSYPFLW